MVWFFLAETHEDLQYSLNSLYEYCNELSLKGKTEKNYSYGIQNTQSL